VVEYMCWLETYSSADCPSKRIH